MKNNKETLKTYERIAQTYATLNADNETIRSHRERFNTYLNEGVVYDLGCGTGRDVYAFTQMGYKAFGFDGSEAMLAMAKQTYPHMYFEQLDMLESDWGLTTKADGIWSCASLLHFEVDDFKNVFSKIITQLKDDGVFYCSLKIKPSVSSDTVDGRFFQYYSKQWLDNFIESFTVLDVLHYEENSRGNDTFASYFIKKNSQS